MPILPSPDTPGVPLAVAAISSREYGAMGWGGDGAAVTGRSAPLPLHAAENEVATVLAYWGYKPETWRIVDVIPAMGGTGTYPVVDILRTLYIIRRQAPGLTERDIWFRHAFLRHLAGQGLPIPPLQPRLDGSTYALVPLVPLESYTDGSISLLESVFYEVQEYITGKRFVTDGPVHDLRLQAAAHTLGALHRASLTFDWPPHTWPADRSLLAITGAYLKIIHDAGKRGNISRQVASDLVQLARVGKQRTESAARAIEAQPDLLRLHIHGDYQPHNLVFDSGRVVAIYDFTAAHWDWRLLELAYSLLYFSGVVWDENTSATPPLRAEGLDIERVTAFLAAYGREAPPPVEGEAALLADALALVVPIVFANGVAEDVVFPDRDASISAQPRQHAYAPRECRLHVRWAETLWDWLEQHRGWLADAWLAGCQQ